MKKNFKAIAALLMVAMLLVVSCSQEIVAPKTEVDNDLVEAKLNVAFGKAVSIDAGNGAQIGYKYSLTPMWETLEGNGNIYGEKSNQEVDGHYSVSQAANIESMGYVTPGLWKVEVKGYLLSKSETEGSITYSYTNKEVLSGEATVYFGKIKDTVTVFVAPVGNENAKGTVTINLQMQDLENGDKIEYKLDDAESYTSIARGEPVKDSEDKETAAHKYSVTLNNIATGYHTISFKIENQTGGVTRSFYLIEGNDVSITGSVTPAMFADESANISVLSLGNNAIITLSEYTNGTTDGAYKVGTNCTATVSGFNVPTANENATSGITSAVMSYSWYWGNDSSSSAIASTDSPESVTITLPRDPGKYTLSCLATCTVTYKSIDGSTVTYTLYGDAALQEFVVD